ncbi:MAG: hypothetical protein WBW33_04615 [Bryobacteraceae bacterium]
MDSSLKRVLIALVILCITPMANAAPQGDDFMRAMNEGQSAAARARFPEAITHFEKAAQLDPRSASARISLADALMRSVSGGMVTDADIQTLQRAKKEEQTALELSPSDAEALAGLGEVEYRLGFGTGLIGFKKTTGLAAAKDALARAIAADPNNFHANYMLVRIASAEVVWRISDARSAAGLKPGLKQDLPPAVKVMLRGKCDPILQKGIEHADTALRIRPNAFEAMHELGGLYFLRSLIDETSAEAEADLKRQQDWQAKSQQAYARYQRASAEPAQPPVVPRTFPEAMAQGKKALALYHYEAAVYAFEKAVKFNDKSVDAHVQLANALIQSSAGNNSSYPFDPERLQRAIQEDRKALGLAPHNAEGMAGIAAATYALNKAARVSAKVDPYTEARDWAKKSIAADAKNYHANYLIAVMAAQQAGVALFEAQSEAYKKGIRDHQLPPDVVAALRQNYGALVEEGLRCAQTALTVQPGSYLAMYQLSSLYGVRNQLGADSARADLGLSNEWRNKAVRLVAKDDPDGQLLRMMQSSGAAMGAIGAVPSAAPPPATPGLPK